jgi:hypothetical protein
MDLIGQVIEATEKKDAAHEAYRTASRAYSAAAIVAGDAYKAHREAVAKRDELQEVMERASYQWGAAILAHRHTTDKAREALQRTHSEKVTS